MLVGRGVEPPDLRERLGGEDHLDSVLVEHAACEHLELELPDRAQDRVARALGRVEALDDALFGQLIEPLAERLVALHVLGADGGEHLGREARKRRDRDPVAGADHVADAQEPRVDEADHVARVGHVDRLALLGEQRVRPREPQRAAAADVGGRHAALEGAGGDARVGRPVAVALVEVRLQLEDHGREVGARHRQRAAVQQVQVAGRGRQAHEVLQEDVDAEVVEHAPEEDGRDLGGEHRRGVGGRQERLDRLDLVDQARVGVDAQELGEVRVVDAAHRDHPGPTSPFRALVEVHRAPGTVVHAAEVRPAADGPGHRRRREAEDLLDLVEQVEGVARRTVELVDEGEGREPSAAADLEQLERLLLHPTRCVEQHHRGVRGGERAVGVLAEVLVAGGVEQVQHEALVVHLQGRGGDRDAALALHRHPVRRRPLGAHLAADDARLADRARVQEQLLGERGLAGVRVRDDREGPSAGDLGGDGGGARHGPRVYRYGATCVVGARAARRGRGATLRGRRRARRPWVGRRRRGCT